jgi:hypothetical protein
MDDLRLKTVLSGLRATVCFDEFDFVTRVKVREIGKPPRDKYMSRGTQVGGFVLSRSRSEIKLFQHSLLLF